MHQTPLLTELGRTNAVKMTINASDHKPIKMRTYRAPINKIQVISQAVGDMLEVPKWS